MVSDAAPRAVAPRATTPAEKARPDEAPREVARYWQHGAVEGVDLLHARYVTHRYGRHAHETYTLGLIEAGVEEFDYGSDVFRAGPGAVALLDPDVVHTGQAGTPSGWRYRVLYPQVSVVTEVAAELGWRAGTPSFPQTVVYDAGSAAALRAAHRAAEYGDQLASSSLLRTALAGLLRAHATPGPATGPVPVRRAPQAVATVRSLLAERIADPPSLAELAALTGLSQFALLRAFRDATGLPPHAYLNQLRVRKARLLLDDGLPPADVAARTGFADQAHLTRHFKRVVGVPPAAYQRERLRRAS
jgi:AraC-like DNA-binding protein